MPIHRLIRIAARNLLRQARHSSFALAAIIFGVAGLALADGFIRDVFFQLGEATVRAELGHLQINRPGFRDGATDEPESVLIEQPQALRAILQDDARIESLGGRLQLSGLLNAEGRDAPVQIEGVEHAPESRSAKYLQLLEGTDLMGGGGHSALLGEGVARRLGIGAEAYTTVTAATFDGAMNSADLKVAGVFRSFSKDFDDRTVRMRLEDAQDLAQAGGIHALVLYLKNTDDTDLVLAELRSRPEFAAYEIWPWYELSDFYRSTRQLYARQFGVLQLIALALIATSVLTSFNITIFERTAEFGTMRALGARSRRIVQLIALEATVLGVVGAVLGMLAALAIGALISRVGIPMPPPPNSEAGFVAHVLLTPAALFSAATVGVGSAVIGALIPSFRTALTPIVTALGHRL